MSGCGDRVPGWIDIREMEFVLEQMESFGPTGKILEVGSATGRLFDFLYEKNGFSIATPKCLSGCRCVFFV